MIKNLILLALLILCLSELKAQDKTIVDEEKIVSYIDFKNYVLIYTTDLKSGKEIITIQKKEE